MGNVVLIDHSPRASYLSQEPENYTYHEMTGHAVRGFAKVMALYELRPYYYQMSEYSTEQSVSRLSCPRFSPASLLQYFESGAVT